MQHTEVDYAAGALWEVSMEMLIFVHGENLSPLRLIVTDTECSLKLTTAAALYKGAAGQQSLQKETTVGFCASCQLGRKVHSAPAVAVWSESSYSQP